MEVTIARGIVKESTALERLRTTALEQKEETTPKRSGWQEINQTRAEINKIDTTTTTL